MPTLNWLGKDKVVNYAAHVPYHVLNHIYNHGGASQNKIIHGDNLLALKNLLPLYEGRVKCIYIDPPYNTGNENWVYNDNVNSPQIQKWLGQVVGKEGEDLTRHDKWLCMMYPRLKLLKNLLSDDGAIFISIDDNEQANLKLICDEIFGANNLVNVISVKMSESTGVKMAHVEKKLPKLKEYLLFYKKNSLRIKDIRVPKTIWDSEYKTLLKGLSRYELDFIKQVKNDENRTDADVKKVDELLMKATFEPLANFYKQNLISKNSDKEKFKIENAWRIFQTVSMSGNAKFLADEKRLTTNANFFSIITPQNKMYLIKSNYSLDVEIPRIKILFADEYLTVSPGDFWQDIKTTGLDNEGFVDFKNGKKPLRLINRILEMATDKNSIVLDAFAGSGTTAHAVLNLNAADGGDRKFILIEMENYAESITAERVRRVGGNFDFYEVGEELFIDDEINPDVDIEQVREYIWTTETATPYVKPDSEDCAAFLGVYKGEAYYFYEGVLDRDFLATMRTRADAYIIFAESCAIDEEFLHKYKIEFKKIPRDIIKYQPIGQVI